MNRAVWPWRTCSHQRVTRNSGITTVTIVFGRTVCRRIVDLGLLDNELVRGTSAFDSPTLVDVAGDPDHAPSVRWKPAIGHPR